MQCYKYYVRTRCQRLILLPILACTLLFSNVLIAQPFKKEIGLSRQLEESFREATKPIFVGGTDIRLEFANVPTVPNKKLWVFFFLNPIDSSTDVKDASYLGAQLIEGPIGSLPVESTIRALVSAGRPPFGVFRKVKILAVPDKDNADVDLSLLTCNFVAKIPRETFPPISENPLENRE